MGGQEERQNTTKAVCPLLLKKHLKRQLKPSTVYKLNVKLLKSEFIASRIYQKILDELYLP